QSALCSKAALRRSTPKSHSFITSTLPNSVNGLGDGPRECQPIRYRSMQGRILAAKDQRAAGKKCRGHLLGNMPERGGQNRDQFILEEGDRLQSAVFHPTPKRHRRATPSGQGYCHFM